MQERDTSLYEALYPNTPFTSHWPAWDDKGSLCNSLEIREMCHASDGDGWSMSPYNPIHTSMHTATAIVGICNEGLGYNIMGHT